MPYNTPHVAALRYVPEDRRGPVQGRFCFACGSLYPSLRARHTGKPLYGKDHVAAPCTQEGQPFAPGADWWELAVEVLPPPPEPEPEGDPVVEV